MKHTALRYPSGMHLIKLGSGDYEKDGETINVTGWKDKEMVVDSIDSIYKLSKRQELTHYKSTTGDDTLTKDVYSLMYNKLQSHFDEEADRWDSLDSEFDFRKFKDSWEMVTIDVTTKEKIDYKIVDTFESEYSDIKPIFTMATQDTFKSISDSGDFLCNYSPNVNDIFDAICKEFNIDEKDIDKSSHSGIYYHKISKEYVFNDNTFKKFYGCTSSTYNECVKKREVQYDLVRTTLKKHITKKKMVNSILFKNDSELVDMLTILSNKIKAIDTKQKTYSEYNSANKYLQIIIDYVYDRVDGES